MRPAVERGPWDTGEHPVSHHTSPVGLSLCRHQVPPPRTLLPVSLEPQPPQQPVPTRPRYLHRQPGQIGGQVVRPEDLGVQDGLVLRAQRTSPSAWGRSRPTAVCSRTGLAEQPALQGQHRAGGRGRWDLPLPCGPRPEPGHLPARPRAGGGAAPCSDGAFPRTTA